MKIRPAILAGALIMSAMLSHAIEAPQPADADFVTVSPDGHLQTKGQRVRYWGFIGWPIPNAPDAKLTGDVKLKAIAKARADIDLMVKRIDDLGFNLVRNWYDTLDDNYQQGDGSFPDLVAYYFKKLDEKGIRIWQSSLNGMGTFGPDDVGIVDDPPTADAWRSAVQEFVKKEKGKKPSIRSNEGALLRLFDPRMRKLAQERMKKCAQFRNLYKDGLLTSDDPQIAVWELSNEELVFRPLFYGGWQNLPAYFRNGLLAKWTEFLKAKYGDQTKLMEAWKFLLPGEDLAKGTVMLAPLASPARADLAINDANPVVIENLKVMKSNFTRDDFTRARGEDVVEFFTKLIIDYKQDDHNAVKTWGRSCKLSPLIWDCGNCFQIQSTYMHQRADAVSTCAYIKGMAHDPTYKRWPFHSGLEAPPRICWDVPWFEQSSVKGKPHFVYETQIDCRTKYRAEFPARIAAIGAIQDWDIVNWHIYGHSADSSKENPFDGSLHVWHDYLGYGNDEVQCSAMKACAEIFKNGLLKPAPKPTTFTFGRRSLYDPASMDYGRSYGDLGKKVIPTCYRYGLRMAIDPTREDDVIEGPSLAQGVYEPCPVKPNEQIEYDWSKGGLTFDAPGAISYSGFHGQQGGPVKFTNGAVIRDVTVKNPEGIAYPVTPEEGYVAITLSSADGRPLTDTKKAWLSAVSTSFNTGFKLDLTKNCPGMHQDGPQAGPPKEFWGAYPITGKAPVLVARVGATIECPAIDGMKYTLRDWHMRSIGEGKVEGGKLTLSPDQPVFIVELTR